MKNQVILESLFFAGLIIAASFALRYLHSEGFIPGDQVDLSRRVFNVTMGLVLAWIANSVPKRMKPLAETACDPVREQSSRRFGARAILTGGLLYSLAWLALPMEWADLSATILLGSALVLVLTHCMMMRMSWKQSG